MLCTRRIRRLAPVPVKNRLAYKIYLLYSSYPIKHSSIGLAARTR